MPATIFSVAVAYVAIEAFLGIAMVIKYVRESRRERSFERLRRAPLCLVQTRRNSPLPVSSQRHRSDQA